MEKIGLLGCAVGVVAAVLFFIVFLVRKGRAARSGNDSGDIRTSDTWLVGTTTSDLSGASSADSSGSDSGSSSSDGGGSD